MDINQFPVLVLAREYHSRWEVENTLDELKSLAPQDMKGFMMIVKGL